MLLIFSELPCGRQGLRIPCVSRYPSASSSKGPLSNAGNPHGHVELRFPGTPGTEVMWNVWLKGFSLSQTARNSRRVYCFSWNLPHRMGEGSGTPDFPPFSKTSPPALLLRALYSSRGKGSFVLPSVSPEVIILFPPETPISVPASYSNLILSLRIVL